MGRRSLLILVCLCGQALLAEEPAYDHTRVDYVLDEKGKERPVERIADWHLRRAAILEGMVAAMGELPARDSLPPLDVHVHETLVRPTHQRRTISYLAEEGDRVPAYLYLPRTEPETGSAGKRPAMLALHPTSPLGKGVVDGQSELPNRAYARELAERGYIVLAPDYPPFGGYAGYEFENDLYASATMKGIFNHMRGVDLLLERRDVHPNRIGVIGHSLGGHNAIFVGVFDERLRVIVSSCGWTPFHDYYDGKLDGWAQDKYMPRIRTRFGLDPDRMPFDFYELIAALAPRAFFTNSPVADHNFAVAGVKKAIPEGRKIYALLGAEEWLVARYPDAGHDFPPAVREEAYEFIAKALQRERPPSRSTGRSTP